MLKLHQLFVAAMEYLIEYVGPPETEEPPPPNPASPDIDWNNITEAEIDEIVSRLKEKIKTHLGHSRRRTGPRES